MEKRPPADYFIKFWREYREQPKRLSAESPNKVYLDSSPDSQEVVAKFISLGQSFEPVHPSPAEITPPSASFGPLLFRGKQAALSMAAGSKAFGDSFTRGLRKNFPNHTPTSEDLSGSALRRVSQMQDWAYAEAVASGREMTHLSETFQDTDRIRYVNFWNALGKALVMERPMTYLGYHDQPIETLHMGSVNLQSLAAIEEAEQSGRAFSRVDYKYHQQWLWYRNRDLKFQDWVNQEA